MNNYKVIENCNGTIYENDFENDIIEAISFYKGLCETSTLSTACTIELIKNGEVINRATFQEYEKKN